MVEIHQMSSANGVSQMCELKDGREHLRQRFGRFSPGGAHLLNVLFMQSHLFLNQ